MGVRNGGTTKVRGIRRTITRRIKIKIQGKTETVAESEDQRFSACPDGKASEVWRTPRRWRAMTKVHLKLGYRTV